MAGKQAKILTPAQLQLALRRTSRNRQPVRDRVIILLSHRAGLRAAEIAGLRWQMCLASDGTLSDYIALADQICKRKRGRTIPIHPDLRRALVRLRQLTGSDGHVAKSERGDCLRPHSVVQFFRSLYADCGFAGCSSHSGRRTFITTAARKFAKAGGSLRDVQLLAGHASITMTQSYIDGSPDAQRKLIALL